MGQTPIPYYALFLMGKMCSFCAISVCMMPVGTHISRKKRNSCAGNPRYTMVHLTMLHLYDGHILLPFVSVLCWCLAFTRLEIPAPQPLGGKFPINRHFLLPPFFHLLGGQGLFSHCVYYITSTSINNPDRLCIICESCMYNNVDKRGKYRAVCRRG